MNNTPLYLSVGLPTMVFILTWLANRAEMNRHITRVDRSIESVCAELAAMRNDHHKHLVALVDSMVPLHERMAKLESQK